MHEISLCEGILQIVEDAAKRDAFSAVRRVRLEIGRFSGIEVGALRFGFDVVMKGSLAEGAALEIIEVPGEAYCFDCGESVAVSERFDPCPRCGGARLSPTGGTEMRIRDLEVI